MSKLTFPFWIVTQRHGLIPHPIEPDGMPGLIAAFTTVENASAFMAGRGETDWENKLVARSTFASLMENLRQIGVQGVCIDPLNDKHGTKITFDDMAKV